MGRAIQMGPPAISGLTPSGCLRSTSAPAWEAYLNRSTRLLAAAALAAELKADPIGSGGNMLARTQIWLSGELARGRSPSERGGMARRLRVQYPGALYHVIYRGNYRPRPLCLSRRGEIVSDHARMTRRGQPAGCCRPRAGVGDPNGTTSDQRFDACKLLGLTAWAGVRAIARTPRGIAAVRSRAR